VLILTVCNYKGGTGKTTSAAFLAHVLAESGLSVLVIDSDPQGSCLRWSETGEWSIPVVGLPVRDVHTKLPGIVGDRFDAVVIDTPPLHDERGIVASSLRAATHVLTPIAPTPVEYDRLADVREAVADAGALRADGPPEHAVLLTRTVPSAASTEAYRAAITEDGLRVLKPTVGRRERFAQAYGDPIERASATAYGDAVAELLGVEVDA
jgi:chromosome partitioning protein